MFTAWTIRKLKSTDTETRRRAIETMGRSSSPAFLKPLLASLRDPEATVAASAVKALGKRRDADAVVPMLEFWNSWGNKSLPIPQTIEEMGEQAIPALALALKHPRAEIRACAAALLGSIGGTSAADGLIGALADSEAFVRRSAAQALDRAGWCPGEPYHEALKLVAEEKWDEAARFGRSVIDLLFSVPTPVLPKAIATVGTIGDAAAVDRLCHLVTHFEFDGVSRPEVREAAVKALVDIGDPRAIPALFDVCRENPYVGAKPLATFGDQSVEYLRSIVRDAATPWTSRQEALKVLATIPSPLVEQELVSAMSDTGGTEGATLSRTAADALAARGWQPANDSERTAFLIAKQDWATVSSLGHQALEALIWAALELDQRSDDMGALLAALVEIDHAWPTSEDAARVVPRLIRVVSEAPRAAGTFHDPMARGPITATFLLGLIGRSEAIECLSGALGHPAAAMRLNAAEALGRIGDVRALASLCDAVGDRREDVRRGVVEALIALNDKRAADALVSIIRSDPHAELTRDDGFVWNLHTQALALKALFRLEDDRALPLAAEIIVHRGRDHHQRNLVQAAASLSVETRKSEAVGVLLQGTTCPKIAYQCIDGLARLLEEIGPLVPEENLERVLALEKVLAAPVVLDSWGDSPSLSVTGEHIIDCTRVKGLARAELDRRRA